MAQSEIDICNLAIGRIGGEPIDAIDEETPLGAFCAGNYPQKRDWLLGKYRWSFANGVKQLARKAVTPADCPAPYAFDLPADLIGAVHAYRPTAMAKGPSLRVQLVNGYAASSDLTLWAEYTRRVPEPAWPVWFTELVVTAFAADLARGPGQSRTLGADMDLKGFGSDGEGGLLLAAKMEDARNAPERTAAGWDDGALVAARFGYGDDCGARLRDSGERFGLTFVDFPPFGEAS